MNVVLLHHGHHASQWSLAFGSGGGPGGCASGWGTDICTFFCAVFFSRTFYYYLILSDYPCSEACTGGRHVTFCTYILHKFLGSKQSCALMVRLVKLEWVCRLQQLLVSAVCGTSQKTKWIQQGQVDILTSDIKIVDIRLGVTIWTFFTTPCTLIGDQDGLLTKS